MNPFIRNDQYNFIQEQTQLLVNGHASVQDNGVLDALNSHSAEKVYKLFTDLTVEQTEVLEPILKVKNKEQAERFLSQIKPYLVSFKPVKEQSIKKLFPKVKKLKTPLMENVKWKEISYLGWDDPGTQKKYILAYFNNRLTGLQGSFKPSNKKGYCALCHKQEDVGMFMTEMKGSVQGTFVKRGNYICKDSEECNRNITSLDKLHDFIWLMLFNK
ncbi:elongation factor G-binding protein [Jeotgalibacillus sp. S-D1]|uniref:FusB/FusC family EF-G-binding protein n=1 Tax=Jeotgalibacillus sp. S-D1 TaxID=2552189 RepID=UPI00105AA10A|nr:FusB/FusC family EF-G-binding protein [Jeotgalibacillus sp. S-D1]TDL30837.1 elongation factor G-binding protein [Jeotgalibacillus sp. S-D1]